MVQNFQEAAKNTVKKLFKESDMRWRLSTYALSQTVPYFFFWNKRLNMKSLSTFCKFITLFKIFLL